MNFGWLNTLNSTNLRILVGSFLAVATGAWYTISVWHAKAPDATTFGLWLAFVASHEGIAYAQFAKKRDSFAPPSPDSERPAVAPLPDDSPATTPAALPASGGLVDDPGDA